MSKTYHYTIADRLVKIMIDGHINIMKESSKVSKDEVCVAWLTVNPEWDKTAFYKYSDETLDNAGRIRITLNGTWIHYRYYRDLMPMVDMLELLAIAEGVNPEDWRVSTNKIEVEFFEKIELWKDGTWIEIPIVRKAV